MNAPDTEQDRVLRRFSDPLGMSLFVLGLVIGVVLGGLLAFALWGEALP